MNDPKRLVADGYDVMAETYAEWGRSVNVSTKQRFMATALEFPPASVDLVTAFFSLIHVPRQEHAATLCRIARWLAPGGVLIVTMGTSDSEGIEDDWLGAPMYWSNWNAETNKELVAKAGLDIASAEEVTDLEDDVEVTHLWLVARKPA